MTHRRKLASLVHFQRRVGGNSGFESHRTTGQWYKTIRIENIAELFPRTMGPGDSSGLDRELKLVERIGMLPRQALAIVTLVIATILVAPSMLAISLLPHSSGAMLRLMKLWARVLSKSMGLTFSIEGSEKVLPETSYIIASNHQGIADGFALTSMLPVRFRLTMKRELLKIPLLGWALGRASITVDRSKGAQAMKQMREGSGKLTHGWSVVVFVEGTRSRDGGLQPFKRGAFVMAVNSGISILPVTVNGSFKVFPRNTLALRSGHITVTIDDPIETQGMTEDDVPELMEKTRDAMMRNLDVDYDPFIGRVS